MSGYVPCGCRDCFDLAISAFDDAPALCLQCKDAGCELSYQFYVTGEGGSDCQREDAYDLYDVDAPVAFWPEEMNGHA